MKQIPYGKQSISDEDIDVVGEALKKPIITRGETVEEFERQLASYCGAGFAVAFNSGSSALLAAYHAAELSAADRVITTPNSFVATVAGTFLKQATPVFVDIDLDSGNLNLEQVGYTIDRPASRGKTVIAPVHFAGIPVDMNRLDKLTCDPRMVVIEDAAHALGSSYIEGQKVGSCAFSQMTVFSFHPIKSITTGEGGMVTTNDEELYHRLRRFRNNGIERTTPWAYDVKEVTGNYNFTDFQAALGLSQLKRLDRFVEKRRQLMQTYREKLNGLEHVKLFSEKYDPYTAYHICVAQIDFEAYGKERDAVMQNLQEKGVGTQVHYIPLYRHSFFRNDIKEYFPNMEKYYSQALTLPLFYDMPLEDVDYIVNCLKEALG